MGPSGPPKQGRGRGRGSLQSPANPDPGPGTDLALPPGTMASLGDLIPDPGNARRHTPRGVGMIEDGLKDVGAARSIVIDEDNVVMAGNATVEAAGNAGIERVRIIEADGNEVIAVRRRGLTPEQKRRLALYDNRASEFSDWDAPVIAEMAKLDFDFKPFFSTAELEGLLSAAETDFVPSGEDDQTQLGAQHEKKCPNCGYDLNTR
jgi:hypothetical protein